MFIFSQDRKSVFKMKSLKVDRSIGGGKEKKFALVVGDEGLGLVVAGYYPDEKTAMDALEKVYQALADGVACYRLD